MEILSPGDRLATTQAKMQEYLDNACHLGWWMNRKQPPEALDAPTRVSGGELLPGFCLDLTEIW